MRGKLLPGVWLFVFAGVWNMSQVARATDPGVPEPFQQFDSSSQRTIDYEFLTLWLNTVVVDIGRSDRRYAAHTRASLGTRIKAKIKRPTIYEGNRVFFEALEDNGDAKQLLGAIRKSLEQLPDKAPLKMFSRPEQLAYWLNLYNVTLLNEIASVYPKRDLKDLLAGGDSILRRKLLTVSGIKLSLDDIQHTILKHNYDNDPLIIYGLYQGIVGGPNIRRTAYSGQNVYLALADNATEFVNSNRGTSGRGIRSRTFYVSSFYARNEAFFPEFEPDLTAHLLEYLEGPEREQLTSASRVSPSISDWTVTDLFGTYPVIRNGISSGNPAALMGALRSTTPGDPLFGGGVVTGAAVSNGSSGYLAKAYRPTKYSHEALKHLRVINTKRIETNRLRGSVTIEDLEDVPVDPDDKPGNHDEE